MAKDNNWDNKEKRAHAARQHTDEMERKYQTEILKCAQNTLIFDHVIPAAAQEVILEDIDSVSAIFKHHEGKTAVLNFASFKNPGGMFLNGSRAQEECLCHASYLYNVLAEKQHFYNDNQCNLNRALYRDRALYSPDVRFFKDDEIVLCDVITCAAPNYTAAKKYCGVSMSDNMEALLSRIKFVIDIAENQNVDTLILGAYGCGVFGQNPDIVASFMQDQLRGRRFKKVIIAVPNNGNGNYEAFSEYFA